MAMHPDGLRLGEAVAGGNPDGPGSLSLTEKTRRLVRSLQDSVLPVDFAVFAGSLSTLIACNVFLVNLDREILGHCVSEDYECRVFTDQVVNNGKFPREYAHTYLTSGETVANIAKQAERENECIFKPGTRCHKEFKMVTIVPIKGSGERLGTLLLTKFGCSFSEEDLILAEFGAAMAGMEMLRARCGEEEEEFRRRAAAKVAVGSLSFSELEAMRSVFAELGSGNGILVASKIADRMGLTRSVIVNGLRKLGSAGVIAARSLGMKGTHIQVLNHHLAEVLRS